MSVVQFLHVGIRTVVSNSGRTPQPCIERHRVSSCTSDAGPNPAYAGFSSSLHGIACKQSLPALRASVRDDEIYFGVKSIQFPEIIQKPIDCLNRAAYLIASILIYMLYILYNNPIYNKSVMILN